MWNPGLASSESLGSVSAAGPELVTDIITVSECMVAFRVARSRLVHIQIHFKHTGVSFLLKSFVMFMSSSFHFVHRLSSSGRISPYIALLMAK